VNELSDIYTVLYGLHLTPRRGARETSVDRAKAKTHLDHVEKRKNYLGTLVDYLRRPPEKLTRLWGILTDKPGIHQRATVKGSQMESTLGGGYMLEALDPLNRNFSKFCKSDFTTWLTEQPQQNRAGRPEYYLVMYFLRWETQKHAKGSITGYARTNMTRRPAHGPMASASNAVLYENGCACTFYGKKRENEGNARVVRYKKYDGANDPKSHCAPYLKHLHTLNSKGYSNEIGIRNDQTTDLQYGYLYVMRENSIVVYENEKGFHSQGGGYQSIQAAGLLAADDGKIVAIDNASGHYAPNYQLLWQAVKKIDGAGAFANGAVVGVGYPHGGQDYWNELFFPVGEFLSLAAAGFPRERTRTVIKKSYKKGPRGLCPTEYHTVFKRFLDKWESFKDKDWESAAGHFLNYVRNETVQEFSMAGTVSLSEWREKTKAKNRPRWLTRLDRIDTRFAEYSRNRNDDVGRDLYQELVKWIKKNPNDFKRRNNDHCIGRLRDQLKKRYGTP